MPSRPVEIVLTRGEVCWVARYSGTFGPGGPVEVDWRSEVPAEVVRRIVEGRNPGAAVVALHSREGDCSETLDASGGVCLRCGAQQWRRCRACRARAWHEADCPVVELNRGRPIAVTPCATGVC